MSPRSAPDPVARWRASLDRAAANDDTFAPQRAAAYARFAGLGFPGARDEDWKYTSLRRLAGREFAPAGREQSLAATPPLAPTFSANRAVLVNGNLHDLASTLGSCPAGLQLRSLVHHHRDAGADSWLRIPAGGGTERFAALNAALCTDALLIDAASTVTRITSQICLRFPP